MKKSEIARRLGMSCTMAMEVAAQAGPLANERASAGWMLDRLKEEAPWMLADDRGWPRRWSSNAAADQRFTGRSTVVRDLVAKVRTEVVRALRWGA